MNNFDMSPHELVKALIDATGEPLTQVAIAMDCAAFQSSLYKFAHGHVKSPKRETAEKIAKYFKFPVDTLYDQALATRIALERGISLTSAPASEQPREVKEPAVISSLGQSHKRRFTAETLTRIERLTLKQFKALESMVHVYLDTVQPAEEPSKALQG